MRHALPARVLYGSTAAVLAGLLVAACGSSSPHHLKAASGTTSTTSTSSTTTTSTTSTTAGSVASSTTAATPSTSSAPTTAAAGRSTATTVKSSGGTTASSAPGGTLGGSSDTAGPSESLTGAGANSIQPFFARAFYYYSQANKGVSVNYSPAGSSVGISDIQSETVDFGDTEIPMAASDEAKAQGGNVLQVPVDLGGVAISYNVPGVAKGLHLNADVLADIYLAKITKWNDPAIAALNPGVNLPDISVIPVHRADSSGPGWDLDEYLIKGSSTWVSTTGTSTPSKSWPEAKIGVGEQLNTGVASYIQQNQGAIGFVEFAYSQQAGFTNAALLNPAGSWVSPSESSIAAAGAQASAVTATNFDIVNSPGASTYPLANFSWTLLYQKQSNTNKGIALGKLFDWVTTSGQTQAAGLGYAPLPANIVSLAHSTLLELESSSGQHLFS